ncbi:MAG TPA: OmpA family protein [Chthoniobacterales bacterium]|jgi:outer membrane protein OmpA-like peptidoglycan-associated protein
MKRLLILTGLLALTACGKKPALSPAVASPTPVAAAPAASPSPSAPPPAEVGVETTEPVEAPAQVDLDPKAVENQRVKEEVLKRIDLMPDLSADTKDKLYVQVDRARAMGKVITIPFPSGRKALNASEIAAIGEKLQLPQVRELTDDPTVIFVVLGFADKKGDPKQNQEISLARANAVLGVLQSRFQLMNVMHSVGMGSSEMFDAQNLDKNRVVELWAVLP